MIRHQHVAEVSTSVMTPWYLGITQTPKNYYRGADIKTQLGLNHHFDPPQETFDPDPQLAWWKFKALQNRVREDFESRVKVVQPVWAAFEDQTFRDQPTVEKTALELWQKDQDAARAHLTQYCSELAARACREADKLAETLRDTKPDDLAKLHTVHPLLGAGTRGCWWNTINDCGEHPRATAQSTLATKR